MLPSGNSAVTADGCPVELYRRLPYCGEVAWLLGAALGRIGSIGSITMYLESETREADIAHLCVRYEDAASVWRHDFSVRALDDAAVNRRLRNSGFGSAEWLNERATWGLAR